MAWLFRLVFLCLLLGAVGFYIAGTILIYPAQQTIGPPPADLNAKEVTFPSASGAAIHGWFIPGTKGKGAIGLFHGIRSDRRSMIPRAEFLHQIGYSVLLIDFQAHGESQGSYITAGALESRDVEAAITFLHNTVPNEPIRVIGVSMGGASIILANQPLGVQAIVLESVYPTIEEALNNRLHMFVGNLSHILTPLFLMQMKFRTGITTSELHPIDHVAELQAPVLIMQGTDDQRTTLEESKRLFLAAQEPKEFWAIQGAGHVDLYSFEPQRYRDRITAFFVLALH